MRRTNKVKFLVVLLWGVFLSGGVLHAELPERPEWMPELSVSSSFMTKYIWRGWNLGDEPVMQLDGSLSKHGITAGVWANYTFNRDRSQDGGRYKEFTELDYYIDYTFNVGDAAGMFGNNAPEMLNALEMSVGYTYYTFPDVDRSLSEFDSHELYIGMAADYFISPYFTWYWDVGTGGGSYYLLGLGHEMEVARGITANFDVTGGYIHRQWTDGSGLADMVLSTSLDIPVLEHFTISPAFAYSIILDRDTYGGDERNEYYGGISIAFSY